MRTPLPRLLGSMLVVSLLTLLVLAGCAPSSPQDQVAKTRGQYTVKLNSFRVIAPETPDPLAVTLDGEAAEGGLVAEGEAAAEGAIAEEAEGEEGEEVVDVEPLPSTTSVLFDLVVRFEGKETLPGITLDITQADPFGTEKAQRQHYIDTSGFGVANKTQQISFELDGFDYVDGDGFSVELQPVPLEERGEYREFAEAGP